jgi:uncharacterized protein
VEKLLNLEVPGIHGRNMLTDVFYIADGKAKPVIIFVHGFKGFKDWGHFNLLAEEAAQRGFVFIKFNFSHNGTTAANPLEFSDPEAFGKNNYIIELDDLKKIIDWTLTNGTLSPEIDHNRVYLLGHSRGGAISVLKASEDKCVKKLVTWAAVSDLVNRNKKRTIETWQKDGVVYAHNARTGQDLPMYIQFYDILMANKERLNVLKAARSLSIPFLIIHGTGDEAVPVNDAETLHRSAKHSRLLIIPEAGHTFGARHPFEGKEFPAQARIVIDATLDFLSDQ